jgi:hypothetical protein
MNVFNKPSDMNKFLNIRLLDVIPEQCMDDFMKKCFCSLLLNGVCEHQSKCVEHSGTFFGSYESNIHNFC